MHGIDYSSNPSDCRSCHHCLPQYALQQKESDAYVYRYLSRFSNIVTLFQISRIMCHYSKSDRKLVFNLTHGCFLAPPFSSSNILQRKFFPGQATLHICFNFPTSDYKSLIPHALFKITLPLVLLFP